MILSDGGAAAFGEDDAIVVINDKLLESKVLALIVALVVLISPFRIRSCERCERSRSNAGLDERSRSNAGLDVLQVPSSLS